MERGRGARHRSERAERPGMRFTGSPGIRTAAALARGVQAPPSNPVHSPKRRLSTGPDDQSHPPGGADGPAFAVARPGGEGWTGFRKHPSFVATYGLSLSSEPSPERRGGADGGVFDDLGSGTDRNFTLDRNRPRDLRASFPDTTDPSWFDAPASNTSLGVVQRFAPPPFLRPGVHSHAPGVAAVRASR